MTKVDLCDGLTSIALRQFIYNVTDAAIADQANGKPPQSGRELCERFASNWRVGHKRLASGLYNKIRWSLEVRD